jgi:hypothetical protein
MADEESFLSKTNKFLRSVTGADAYDAMREKNRERLKAAIGEKGVNALDNASEALSYAELGMMGKAGKVKKAKEAAMDLKRGDSRMKALESYRKGLDKAKPKIGRAARPGEKNFVGPVRPPAAGDKKFIGPTRPPKAGEKGFVGPTRPPKAGEEGFIGPTAPKVKAVDKRGIATVAGLGAAGVGALGYKAATTPNAAERKTFGGKSFERGKGTAALPASKSSSGTTFAKGKGTAALPVKKPSSGSAKTGSTAPAPKAASDKSRVSGKMTSFQRMKARQFEKEGVAGRSMTRAAAQKKAMEKSGGFASLFSRKPASKPMSAGKSKSQLASEFRAKQQGLRKK